jgi:hypothetical protein
MARNFKLRTIAEERTYYRELHPRKIQYSFDVLYYSAEFSLS